MRTFILFGLLLFSSFVHALETRRLELQGAFHTYYQNHPDKKFKDIEHAIISVSGSERNAETYLKSMDAVAKRLQVQSKTLVWSPHFKNPGDVIEAKELVYSYEGWWIGDQSVAPHNKVSSFEVIDSLLRRLMNKTLFPKLQSIVLTGHSAGGHLVQRFALGSRVSTSKSGVTLRYVVSNPGTYAYLNAKRWVNNQLRIPLVRCKYNNYKYGLENLNSYMSRTSPVTMISTYLRRDVTYFLGDKDIGKVEQSCEAQVQGATRFDRGKKFKAFLDSEYKQHQHDLVIVPEVGHSQHGMYNSREAEEVIFKEAL